MEKYFGKSAHKGIAIGEIFELEKVNYEISETKISNKKAEIDKFIHAQKQAVLELQNLYKHALKEVGENNATIFEVHQMMLEDEDFVGQIINFIEDDNFNAAYAVQKSSENFADIFLKMNDKYMNDRSADVYDISKRLIKILLGNGNEQKEITKPCIVVADDLSPSETVQLDKTKVLAFVTRQGSFNSHTAILARTLDIPAIVSCSVSYDIKGKNSIVNSFEDLFIVEPTDLELEKAKKIINQQNEKNKLLDVYVNRECQTKSGKKIKLYANVGSLTDMDKALANGAKGIGLFRSEFIYLEKSEFPNEEEQFTIYKNAIEKLNGKTLVIRTLDIGADKQIDYFNLDKEENPALGLRAIRFCLSNVEVFKTQLKALIRASAYGEISIMIPMITNVWEIKKVKGIMNKIKVDFKTQGINYGNISFGIMIETPAAVIIADDLAKEVDFFSIGTNDLTQYCLAVDRQNQKLDMFYNPHHKAILKMIKMTIEAAHKNEIWVGICGELASDLSLIETFINYDIDELSVSPSMILPVKKTICDLD
ncbi:MAG: phosphoenolpyruvate--protein phosphotransferase [Clostridia bacterium]